MAYEVWRGARKFHDPLESLAEAKAVVEADAPRNPVLASPFGGSARITWAWALGSLDTLEARNGETGDVAYEIRRVPGT